MMPNGKSLPASGKHVEFWFSGIATVKGGKLSSLHVYFDALNFLTQVGAIPQM